MKAVQLRQLLLLIILVLAFLLVVSAFIVTSSGFAAAEPGIAAALAEAGVDSKKKDIIQYRDDNVIIFDTEEIQADILVIDGIISVNGTVYGDVIGIRSDVILENNAVVFGNIICYQGDVRKESGSRLAGDVIRFDGDDVSTVKYRDSAEYAFPYHIFNDDDEIDVESYETIGGDVILVDGDISVRGKIDGDIIALNSDVEIIESAAVDGHVIAYDCECDIEDGALITGVTIETEELEDEDEDVEYADDREAEIQRSIERKYLSRHDDVVRFFGDATIESNEIIEGEVVVMKGTATLRGEINGDVVAIFGDVDIDSSAYVSGNVVSVGGKINKSPGAYVGGDVIRTTWTGAKVYDDEDDEWEDYDRKREREREWERERDYDRYDDDGYYVDRWSREENELDDFLFRYNRVEGLFLGFIAPKNKYDRLDRNHVKVFGHAGYGFKSKEARYRVGIERWIFNDFRFTIGAEAFDLTDTQDRWIMPSFENTLAALLLREDFHDFYRRVGFSAYARQNITENFRVEVGYRKDRFYNMEKKTNWSVFGGDKKFRENPLVDEIEARTLCVNVGLDTRNHLKYPQQGWYINLSGEFTGPDLDNEEVDFDRFIVDLKRYQPIGYGENLDMRLRAGSARGELPVQYLYDLGGISTLRGYDFKEFENGDRMILANVEYRVYGSRLDFIGIDDLNFVFFGDAGLVWNAGDKTSPENGFSDLTWRGLKKSYGFALTNYDGNVRLSFAQRMDDRSKPVVITFRLRRPF